MNYRIYLLDGESHIRAAETFSAGNDVAARELAATVFNACSDAFCNFELWRGPTFVAAGRADGQQEMNIEEFVAGRQQASVDLEERLQRSFECVARSKRLLEVTTALNRYWQ